MLQIKNNLVELKFLMEAPSYHFQNIFLSKNFTNVEVLEQISVLKNTALSQPMDLKNKLHSFTI